MTYSMSSMSIAPSPLPATHHPRRPVCFAQTGGRECGRTKPVNVPVVTALTQPGLTWWLIGHLDRRVKLKKRLVNSRWIDGHRLGRGLRRDRKADPEADGPLLVIAWTRGMRSQIVQRAASGRPG